MNKIKLILVFVLLACMATMFAQTASVGFRDAGTGTRTIVRLQDPAYPNATPVGYARFLIQMYKSTDDVIDPLGSNGLPTGDDIVASPSSPTSGNMTLAFGPSGAWAPSSYIFAANGGVGDTWQGDKVYLRIFNAGTIAAATKYIQFTGLYTVPATGTYLPSILVAPINNWNSAIGTAGWVTFYAPPPVPAPAVLVGPADTSTDLAFAGQSLEWTAGTGSTPSGYVVYFDTVNPPVATFGNQSGTVKPTGALLPNTWYYWKVVPWNATGDAVGCSVWSFKTRAELNPNAAINPSPSDTDAFSAPPSLPFDQTLSWSAARVTVIPTGYKVYFDDVTPPVHMVSDQAGTSYIVSIPAAGTYYWKVVPYYTDPGTRRVTLGTPVSARITSPGNTRGDATGCPIWSFTVTPYVLPTYTVEITSTPSGAAIWASVGKTVLTDTGEVTPHTFTVNQGASATYEVVMDGYNWTPTSVSMGNIQQNYSWNFVGTLKTYTVDITSTPSGAAINVGGVYSGHDTPWQFTMNWHDSATYEASLAGYTFSPTILSITNIEANASQEFTGSLITYTVDITSTPTGASISVDGIPTMFTTPKQFVLLPGANATYTVSMAGYTFLPAEFVVTNIAANTSQEFTGTVVGVPDIPAGGSTDVGGGPAGGGATIETTIDLYNGPVVPGTDPVFLLLPNMDNITSPIILSYTGTGTGDLTITVGVGTWWGLIYYGGMWHVADLPVPLPLVVMSGTGELVFNNVNFGAKGDIVVLLTEGADPTLPVELSSFTAVLTSQYFISLTWVTESETEVLGFNVYRSDNSNYADAVRLNPVIIPATNTSQQQTYTMTDTENLVTNQTYYYWLESVDIGGAAPSLHGPISALVTGQPTPTLPEVSIMRSAYPNPFRVGNATSIDVNIKAGEAGTVTIYNILGQTVKTFNVKQGEHKLTWNAKGCASGIYFYKLSTPSTNTTKKLVIVN